jgi:hypothetical protein
MAQSDAIGSTVATPTAPPSLPRVLSPSLTISDVLPNLYGITHATIHFDEPATSSSQTRSMCPVFTSSTSATPSRSQTSQNARTRHACLRRRGSTCTHSLSGSGITWTSFVCSHSQRESRSSSTRGSASSGTSATRFTPQSPG